MNRLALLTAAALAVVVLAAPAAAHADLIATTEVPSLDGSNLDLGQVNIATRGISRLSSANSSADELHPSVAGNLLVFERFSRSAGTVRIILRNTSTGAQADLFNVFDASAAQPNDPALAPDGQTVVTGRAMTLGGNGVAAVRLETTDVSAFPTGPFPHSVLEPGETFAHAGRTLQALVTGTNPLDVWYGVQLDSGQFAYGRSVGNGHGVVKSNTEQYAHPAPTDGGATVVFERTGGASVLTRLAFATGSVGATDLPSVINAADSNETRPAFSSDGRFIAFIRMAGTDQRLFVFDTETQLLVDPTGVTLGDPGPAARALAARDGTIVLQNRSPLIVASTVSSAGLINFRLTAPSTIGIIVQEVVGHHRLLGSRVPTLRFVGRVPLGRFKRGTRGIRWDREVNGRRLAPGLYQVTVRSVTSKRRVRDLGHPVTIRIRKPR